MTILTGLPVGSCTSIATSVAGLGPVNAREIGEREDARAIDLVELLPCPTERDRRFPLGWRPLQPRLQIDRLNPHLICDVLCHFDDVDLHLTLVRLSLI